MNLPRTIKRIVVTNRLVGGGVVNYLTKDQFNKMVRQLGIKGEPFEVRAIYTPYGAGFSTR